MNSSDIPEGFAPDVQKSPITDPWEPLYSKRTEKAVVLGLRVAKPHTNQQGLVHGGLIATLADSAMAYSCRQVMGSWASWMATISLTVDFVGPAQIGQWLTVESDVIKNRQNDLLRAKPDQGRQQRNRSGERYVSRSGEAPKRHPFPLVQNSASKGNEHSGRTWCFVMRLLHCMSSEMAPLRHVGTRQRCLFMGVERKSSVYN